MFTALLESAALHTVGVFLLRFVEIAQTEMV
jgi:hypothetical protein